MKERSQRDEFSPAVPVRFFEVDCMAVQKAIVFSSGLSQVLVAFIHQDAQKPSRPLQVFNTQSLG